MNTSCKLAIATTALIAGILITASSTAQSQQANLPIGPINLQDSTPGAAQIGHGNITGTFKAGYLKGNGLGVTGLNANNVAVGTLNDARLSTNIPRLNAFNTFATSQEVVGALYITGSSYPGLVLGKTTSSGDQFAHLSVDGQGEGYFYLLGANHNMNVWLDSIANYPNNGYMGVFDSSGTAQARMYVSAAGQGVVSADVKNFVVPNPKNASEDIVYACVEGPEAAAYVRGVGHLVNGKAHIDLPDHFASVTVSGGMTVQITPKSAASEGLSYSNDTNTGFDVAELHSGKGNYDFAWEVKAVRRMHEDYVPVRPWDEALPGSTDRKAAWSGRIQSINQRENAYAAQRLRRP
ncbi:MAG: hypothetical protein JSS66_15855 [Armatimonadetes bacterium]|nr:hypothetical protein [Armatimonadota bacterium]